MEPEKKTLLEELEDARNKAARQRAHERETERFFKAQRTRDEWPRLVDELKKVAANGGNKFTLEQRYWGFMDLGELQKLVKEANLTFRYPEHWSATVIGEIIFEAPPAVPLKPKTPWYKRLRNWVFRVDQ